jgi:uncharacterized protein involved in exopolysaccharide biosynthesis
MLCQRLCEAMTLLFLLKRWKWLACAMIAGSFVALVIAAVQKPRYIARMTISGLGQGDSAIQSGIGSGSTGVLQALKGIAGSSGASLTDGDYGYFISLLASDRTAGLIKRDLPALKLLFPSEWRADGHRWRRSSSWSSGLKDTYNRVFFGTSYTAPDVSRIKERLKKIMQVRYDLENNQHIVSVQSTTCVSATWLASKIFHSADQILKAEKGRRYKENIDYLTTQLVDPRNGPLREELAGALLLQHLHQISARSQLPLAVRVIDGPGCEPRPAFPQPVAYLLVGALAGLAVGLCLILLKYLVSEQTHNA